ncbi:hypothetical protein BKA70DRAFT_1444667 [Coprinopsis sp. MPI-PUGE-AT-0042]|nr:hypothetical protein BKA70DRAFT_1444667 [Coprinopsis sp. MPI-PUGE-AT-0042]
MACSTFHNHCAIVLTDGTTRFREGGRGKTADPSTHHLLHLSPPVPSLSTSGVHVVTEVAGDDAVTISPFRPVLPSSRDTRSARRECRSAGDATGQRRRGEQEHADGPSTVYDAPRRSQNAAQQITFVLGSTTAVRDDEDRFGVVTTVAPKALAMFHKTIETLCKNIVGYVGRESHGARWDIVVLIKKCALPAVSYYRCSCCPLAYIWG